MWWQFTASACGRPIDGHVRGQASRREVLAYVRSLLEPRVRYQLRLIDPNGRIETTEVFRDR